MPDTKRVTKKIQLETASCSEPLMPCPLVQPSARRAPTSSSAPPKKAAA